MVKWEFALDMVSDVRSFVAMFMFINEEAVQTVGMACYMLQKTEQWAGVIETAQYALDNLINPAIDFCAMYGYVAVPLNMAYDAFFKAAQKSMQTYITTAQLMLA
jgi:hypothetical protein